MHVRRTSFLPAASRLAITPFIIFALGVSQLTISEPVSAQTSSETPSAEAQEAKKQAELADRFMTVLLRRPRSGTALDRVYGFHVQGGSLESLLESLDVSADDPEAGSKQMILGLLQLQRGKPGLAVAAFENAEHLRPDDAMASFLLGKSQLAVGQNEKAAEAMERAITREPARAEALPIFTELGRLYGRAGQTEKALAVWEKLERRFPGDDKVGGQIAQTLADEGDYQSALDRYASLANSARQAEQKVAFAVRAAEMKRRLGNHDESVTDLENILTRLRPGSWLYNSVRQRIEEGFLKSGDYDALAKYYEDKLESSPDDLEVMTRLGRIYITSRRLEDAERTLRTALEKAPTETEIRLTLIDVLRHQGELTAAADQYEKLVDADPTNPDYLLRWGRVVLEDGDRALDQRRDEAAQIWTRLAEARSDDAVILSQVADAMRSIDQIDQAIDLYRQAIDVAPQSPQYREYLGEYLYKLDRKEAAVETWESMAADDRRDRESLVRLAEVFQTFEFDERALETWRVAAEHDLQFDQELRFARLLRESSLFDEAFERLDRAATLAETPDEREQLLRDRINTYSDAGTLLDQIAQREAAEKTPDNLRVLALLHAAAGELADARSAIEAALEMSPDSVDILLIAAEVSERQNRFADAAEKFRRLAELDIRFKTNHLRRVADLQMRLGKVDEAMKTCAEVIAANPASAESYQFLARLAFRAGRDDEAIAALRTAMNVAPRDNTSRRTLASAFADRFRTDEAIEVYWQAMRYESKLDDQVLLVESLAPLYDRKNEVEDLVRRIEELQEDDVDSRSITVMTAAAYEAVENYGAAKSVLETAIADAPRDVSLLDRMVRVCDLANEVTDAAEYQERIAAIEDTPENRFKLIQFQLEAEMIDIETALSKRISLNADPQRLGRMIRGSVARSDMETAIAICQAALNRDDRLWDVKLYLAQLLLHQPVDGNDDESQSQPYQRAIELANEVRQLDIEVDELAPTASRGGSRPGNNTSTRPVKPTDWSSHYYEVARQYKLGQYSSSSYSSRGTQLVQPRNFGHARVLAATLEFVAISKTNQDSVASKKIYELLSTKYAMPEIDEIDDANVIWDYRGIESSCRYLTRKAVNSHFDKEDKERTKRCNWRLAELDPKFGEQSLRVMLFSQYRQQEDSVWTDEQWELVKQLHDQAEARAHSDRSVRGVYYWQHLTQFRKVLAWKHQTRGEEELAQQYEIEPPQDDATLAELVNIMRFYTTIDDMESAEALIPRLMPAARDSDRTNRTSGSSTTGFFGSIRGGNDTAKALYDEHRFEFLDAALAEVCGVPRTSRRSGLTNGTTNAYVRSSGGGYYGVTIKSPLSADLLPQNVITEFGSFLPEKPNSSGRAQFQVPEEFLEFLDRPVEDANEIEKKTRDVLTAYAHWWANDATECYQRINRLCTQFPDDVDLRIEQARLASEVAQPRIALQKLDSFEPLDSRMLVRKEMAAMNLASRIGDTERARAAAERLFGLRIDTTTQLALTEQLRQLGMNDQAKAMMQRLRGGRQKDERTQIQIANAFLSSGDPEAAAEVAYSVLRKLNGGRSTTNNADYYRRQVVTILRNAKKLDPLIERAKRRLELAPNSRRAMNSLAELYSAAGKTALANEILGKLSESSGKDSATQLLARAESLKSAGKNKEAVEAYLQAYIKKPDAFRSDFYQMYSPARNLTETEFAFKLLNQIDPNAIPAYRIDELLRMGRNGNSSYSEAKRDFLRRMLRRSDLQNYLFSIVRNIPPNERVKIPEVDRTIIDAACEETAFNARGSYWNIYSYTGAGKASGGLEELLAIVKRNQKYRNQFREAATAAKEADQEEHGLTATLLLSLVEIVCDDDDAEDTSKAKEETRASYDAIHQLFVQENRERTIKKVAPALIWQAGLALEEDDFALENKTELLVDLYQTACIDQTKFNNAISFTPAARLIHWYVELGQRGKARELIMRYYEAINHSDENVNNPGYGDYQDINEIAGIASMFSTYDFPIESYQVYQQLLADQAKFERAQRWGGSSNRERYESDSQKAFENITSEAGRTYLLSFGQQLGENAPDQLPRLLEGSPEQIRRSEGTPSILVAIEKARESDEGVEVIDQLKQTVEEKIEVTPDHLCAHIVRVVVLLNQDSGNELTEALDQLMKVVPSEDELAKLSEQGEVRTLERLNDLFVPLIAAKSSDHPDADSVPKQLADYLATMADVAGNKTAELALLAIGGYGEDRVQEILQEFEEKATQQSKLTRDEVAFCLDIADSFVDQGQLRDSARALRIALQAGPPIAPISGGNDPFSLTPIRQNNNNVNEREQELTELRVRLLKTVASWSKPLGVSDLTMPLLSEKPAPQVDAELASQLADALTAIVIPNGSTGMVYPWGKRIASRNGYDRYHNQNSWDVQSLSIALGNLARLAGNTDAVLETIRERQETATDPRIVKAVLVDVACAGSNPQVQSKAIGEFTQLLNLQLPATDAPVVTQTGSISITSQMQAESMEKSDVVDLCMRTLWPIVSHPDSFSKEDVHEASQTLTRVNRLIGSDHYTLGRHREISRRLENQLFTTAAETKDEKTFSQQLESRVQSFFRGLGF
ncbi:tetratricopeptide repeat protein [Roseiconus lacunae]|uniref:tetratricopeptide repeat protein n=1 Tax=Roseiconus lacunae TaxID=2605694 RepID=UPI0011F15D95|nr:tetratricopeptide repeat protein [Roseiconus lacunae]